MLTTIFIRRGARAVEWDGLENRCTGNCTEGSNPSLSARSPKFKQVDRGPLYNLLGILVTDTRLAPVDGLRERRFLFKAISKNNAWPF